MQKWQVDRYSCRSTCSRSTLSELSPRARHNQNNRRSPVFDPSRSTLRNDTRMCSPLEKQAATSPSLDCFRFHRIELQLQPAASVSSTVLYSASCRSFYGVTLLLCEAKKWEQNRRHTTMKKYYSFQKPSLDA